jgi:hypothetical protein
MTNREAWVWGTWAIIAVNVGVFVWGLTQGRRLWLVGLVVVVLYAMLRAVERYPDEKP